MSTEDPHLRKEVETRPLRKEVQTRELRALHCLGNKGPLGGVCAGIAYRLGIPTWVPRVAFVLSTLYLGIGIVPYLILWFVLNNAPTPSDFDSRTDGG